MINIFKSFRIFTRFIRTNYYFINNKKISLKHLGYGQLSNERSIEMKNLLNNQIDSFIESERELFILLEVGSYLGESLEIYGEILSRRLKDNYLIISVDPYGLYVNRSMDLIYMYFINNISKKKFRNNFTHLRMDSIKGFNLLKKFNIQLDFCYLDGSHYYKDIKFEIENFNKILVNTSNYNGSLCGDDCEISYERLIDVVDKDKADNFLSECENIDFVNNFDNKNINFHPGVTLAIKESSIPIDVSRSGFWYKT